MPQPLAPAQLIDLSEEAMRFYAQMADMPPNREHFIRDWVAIALHRRHGWVVTVETTRAQFEEWFAHVPHVDNFRTDMLVWKSNGAPDAATLSAIVEFKTTGNIAHITSDIKRTSRLVTAARAPNKHGVFGYQVICTCYDKDGQAQRDEKNLNDELAASWKSACKPHFERRFVHISKPHSYWCGIFCISVLPAKIKVAA